jgi:hypothetical protein
MSQDAGNLPEIEVEPMGDGEGPPFPDIDPEEIDMGARRMLTRDEAHVLTAAAVVVMAIGLVFSAGWLFMAWRVESQLSGSGSSVVFDSGRGDPDVIDRVIALIQIGPILMLSLLALVGGSGLRLYASRLFTAPEED